MSEKFRLLFVSLEAIRNDRNRAKSMRCGTIRHITISCGEIWCREWMRECVSKWEVENEWETVSEKERAACTAGGGLCYVGVGDNGTWQGNTRRPIRPVG